jgi:hypothetical protein
MGLVSQAAGCRPWCGRSGGLERERPAGLAWKNHLRARFGPPAWVWSRIRVVFASLAKSIWNVTQLQESRPFAVASRCTSWVSALSGLLSRRRWPGSHSRAGCFFDLQTAHRARGRGILVLFHAWWLSARASAPDTMTRHWRQRRGVSGQKGARIDVDFQCVGAIGGEIRLDGHVWDHMRPRGSWHGKGEHGERSAWERKSHQTHGGDTGRDGKSNVSGHPDSKRLDVLNSLGGRRLRKNSENLCS